jgi:CheY-like chemotaxis protein
MNLITNASDAVEGREGVISVITKRVTLNGEPAAASFRTLAQGDYVHLEVSDTGCGMPPQMRTKVFDPFFSTKSAGRGLGLAVVQGIVRSLGGAVDVSSEPGQGTTFQILLPCSESTGRASSHVNAEVEKEAVSTEVYAVLVVEDEEYLRQALAKMLRMTGFQVFEAADGTSAIDLLREHGAGIDAILLDMTLPGPSSREILAEAAQVKPEIRVILTSAYSREMIEGSVSEPQIHSFIRKPFQFEDLLKTLRSSLRS